jgi:hypothetical protein
VLWLGGWLAALAALRRCDEVRTAVTRDLERTGQQPDRTDEWPGRAPALDVTDRPHAYSGPVRKLFLS